VDRAVFSHFFNHRSLCIDRTGSFSKLFYGRQTTVPWDSWWLYHTNRTSDEWSARESDRRQHPHALRYHITLYTCRTIIYDEDGARRWWRRTDGRTDRARDTIYAHELKVVVMPVIYVAFRLCDYNLYVCPALRNETCFWFIFRYYINASARTYILPPPQCICTYCIYINIHRRVYNICVCVCVCVCICVYIYAVYMR